MSEYKPKMYAISFPVACVLTAGGYFLYAGHAPGSGELWLAAVAFLVVTPLVDWMLQKFRG